MHKKQLLPLAVTRRLPSLDATAEHKTAESYAVVKFFYPDVDWTWYGVAWDGEDLFFGYVDGFEPELGYFRLSELMETRGKLGCAIERDRHYEPERLDRLMARVAQRHGG